MLNGWHKFPTNLPDQQNLIYCVDPDQKTLNKKYLKQVLQKVKVSENAISFITKCLNKEQHNRYSWTDVFQHPIFEKDSKNNKMQQKKVSFMWRFAETIIRSFRQDKDLNARIAKAQQLYQKGKSEQSKNFDFIEAMKSYQQAVKILVSLKKEKSQFCGKIFNDMGVIYTNQGYLKSALMCFNKSLAIKEKQFEKNSNPYSDTLGNIGVFFDNQRNYQKAKLCYNQALLTKEKIYGKLGIQCVQIINNIAGIESLNNLDKAIQMYERALKIVSNHFGENSIECALYFNNLGECQRRKGNTIKARELLEKTLGIFTNEAVYKHENRVLALSFMGDVFPDQENLDEALESWHQQKKIFELMLGQKNQNKSYKKVCQRIQSFNQL